jgi:hypothetical protein
MKCPTCGSDNPDNYVFCGRCGAIVQKDRLLDRGRIEQHKKQIADLVRQRRSTDEIISPWWIFVIVMVQIISAVAGIAASISSVYTGASTLSVQIGQVMLYGGSIAAELIGVFLIYHLINRQNRHFAREWRLRASILNLIKSIAGSPEAEALLFRDIGPMLNAHQPAETYRNPMLWAFIAGVPAITIAVTAIVAFAGASSIIYNLFVLVLVLVSAIIALVCGILTFYIYYFLTKDMQEHDKRWWQFSIAATNALTKFGIQPDRSVQPYALPVREPWIYVILSIFIPFFFFFWFYVLITDPNEHFKHQRKFEKWLHESVDKLRY